MTWPDLVGYAHATRLVALPTPGEDGDLHDAPHAPVAAVKHLANHLPHTHGLMHPHRVQEMQERLRARGITRTDTQVDLAIQSAREALHADTGTWPNPDTDHGWWDIEGHAVRFLDLDYDEVFEVAS